MAIKALLLDREKEVFPLLGDIFNVTGHKLLIATNDDMFADLISSTEVDIVLINQTDIKAWYSSLEKGKVSLPFFLTEKDEEEKRLSNIGFSDLNFVRKPFNPLELLNKLSYLHKMEPEENAHQMGFLNAVLKMLQKGKKGVVEISNKDRTCRVEIGDNDLEGIDCTIDELLNLIHDEESIVSVKEYEEIPKEQAFGGIKDFVKTLIERSKPVKVFVSEGEKIVKEVKPMEEIAEGLYRVSRFSSVPVLLKNVYLRVYEGNDKRVAMLINVGTLDEWSGVRNLVEDVLLSMNELDAIVALSGELSSIYNSFLLGEQKLNTRLIADYTVKRSLSEAGCKSSRIRTFEDFPSYSVTIATGHKLRFIPMTFSPSMGGFCLYEEDTGYLFTPEFMSSFFNESAEDPSDEVAIFHRIYMPSGGVLNGHLARISDLSITRILPRYGLPYTSVYEAIDSLLGLKCGVDFPHVSDKEKALEIMNRVLEFVMNNEEKEIYDKYIESLERFATVESGRVTDIYVEPPFVVELLLNAVMKVPGIKPSTVVKTLRILDEEGVFINPF